MMAKNLSLILSKGKTDQIQTQKGYSKAIKKYINKGNSNVTELLITIFENLEQKHTLLESSSNEDSKSIEIIEKVKQKQQSTRQTFQEKEKDRIQAAQMEMRNIQLEGNYFIKIEQNSYEQEVEPEFQNSSSRGWSDKKVFTWRKSYDSDFSSDRQQGEIKRTTIKKKDKKERI